jgi:hypothetical protein
VRAMRFNPVLALETVTRASAMTAPVGSVMVPKTVASWVCGRADAEYTANDRANSMHGLREPRVGHTRNLPIMTVTLSVLPKRHEKGVPGIIQALFSVAEN